MNIKLDDILVLAFFILTGIVAIVGISWAMITEKRLKRFFLGKEAKDLEETISLLEDNIIKLNNAKENLEKDISKINAKLRKSIRGLETIRFNPFPDQGSNQSFAVSLINEDGDGVVLSSLYSRERMSVFAKPIKRNVSEYELSEEEKEAVAKARVS